METQLLQMSNISKRYPGVFANDSISLDVRKGEVHALLGENGAGKTTLMNILYGLTTPDSGKILLNGNEVQIRSPADALRLGIGMVHQHFMLVENFNVLENVVLGLKTEGYPIFDQRNVYKNVTQIINDYRFDLDPLALISQLSVGQQQKVEIVKALYRKADLLILDEPTSVLTPSEAHDLFRLLEDLRKTGHGVIFISHKLNETMLVSNRVTVLRAGRVVSTVETKHTSKAELAYMMVGRSVIFEHKRTTYQGEPSLILDVRELTVENDRGLEAVRNFSLQVNAGEIVGIAGVDGNGQKELVEALTGLRPVKKGSVHISGKNATGLLPNQINHLSVGYIPEDRQRRGLVMSFKITDNIVLKDIDDKPYTVRGVIRNKSIRVHTQTLIDEYDIRPPFAELKAGQLSGGNQQKVILARELSKNPRLIIASQPTRGVDVGASEYVQKKLLEAASYGAGVLLVSTDLEEVLGLSDIVLVIFSGEIVGKMRCGEIDLDRLGLLMGGHEGD